MTLISPCISRSENLIEKWLFLVDTKSDKESEPVRNQSKGETIKDPGKRVEGSGTNPGKRVEGSLSVGVFNAYII